MVLARAGGVEIVRSAVDLTQLAEEVSQDLRAAAPDRRVQFTIESDLSAHADVRLMRIVLENLLGNALKFTGKQPQARIEVGGVRSASVPTFLVRDNGVGFDPHLAAKIFDAFVRLHSAAEFPGTGIGLATVRRIIYRHGGKIWTQSTPGEGATFYFTLPD
jgi:signal transduction histidine kinase